MRRGCSFLVHEFFVPQVCLTETSIRALFLKPGQGKFFRLTCFFRLTDLGQLR